jgi:DNA recombination protein RmuC
MEFLFLAAGIALGFAIAWFWMKSKSTGQEGIPLDTLNANYIQKQLYDGLAAEAKQKDQTILELTRQVEQMTARSTGLEEKIAQHKQEVEELQKNMRTDFKNLSHEIFEEKSTKFLELNEKRVSEILNPLKEKIQLFEQKIDKNYNEETRERASLKIHLDNIVKLNLQVSEGATKLTNALKGDSKVQGDWGEVQLELILTKAGLEKDIHFRRQENFKDEEGRNQRPDYVLNLPDEKNMIIDSKVSLTAYEQYFHEEDEIKKAQFLKAHLNSLSKHIIDLGAKQYQKIYEINAPDYVLLFVPIEPALYTALREDTSLFEKALERNVVLVTTSTLLATLRTISYIWKQENQRRNVVEIAKESGDLYDKFYGFIMDLVGVGEKIDGAKKSYTDAMNKLVESKMKGGTILGKIERIKKLGANTTKSLPEKLLNRIEE